MIEYKYSTFWPRFWAGIVDGLILSPLVLVFDYAFLHLNSVPLRILVYILNSSAFVVYSIWMHAKRGQTLGKMACGVIVLDVSEGPLRLRQAVLRDIFEVVLVPIMVAINIPRIIQGIDVTAPSSFANIDWVIHYSSLGWFLVEIITMFTNNKRRALHDYIAGSVVIRKLAKARYSLRRANPRLRSPGDGSSGGDEHPEPAS